MLLCSNGVYGENQFFPTAQVSVYRNFSSGLANSSNFS